MHILTIQSIRLAANIFEMQWLALNRNVQKSLLIIMNRSLLPIEFSSAYILTMNLDSFVSVSISKFSIIFYFQWCYLFAQIYVINYNLVALFCT